MAFRLWYLEGSAVLEAPLQAGTEARKAAAPGAVLRVTPKTLNQECATSLAMSIALLAMVPSFLRMAFKLRVGYFDLQSKESLVAACILCCCLVGDDLGSSESF